MVVLSVDPKSEADMLGIQVGDIVRAVSFVGQGPDPGWLDKMLGAEAMPMQQAPSENAVTTKPPVTANAPSRSLVNEKQGGRRNIYRSLDIATATLQVMKCDGRSADEAPYHVCAGIYSNVHQASPQSRL